jgi:hypothetical protein
MIEDKKQIDAWIDSVLTKKPSFDADAVEHEIVALSKVWQAESISSAISQGLGERAYSIQVLSHWLRTHGVRIVDEDAKNKARKEEIKKYFDNRLDRIFRYLSSQWETPNAQAYYKKCCREHSWFKAEYEAWYAEHGAEAERTGETYALQKERNSRWSRQIIGNIDGRKPKHNAKELVAQIAEVRMA